jgi:hypothetical protein
VLCACPVCATLAEGDLARFKRMPETARAIEVNRFLATLLGEEEKAARE